MAYEKRYRTVIPVDQAIDDDDLDVVRWLARESIEKAADRGDLQVVDYTETIVDPADLPPKAAQPLGGRNDAWRWIAFEGVARAKTV